MMLAAKNYKTESFRGKQLHCADIQTGEMPCF